MAFEIRANNQGELRFTLADGKPRIDGRAILYNSWSVDLGGFKERLMPNSVQLDPDLLGLFDHNTAWVVGRTSAGTMEVRMDDRGVSFTAYPPETSWAADLRVSLERGDIKGCSFRMMVEEDKWYVDMNGQVCRDILKASVSELTITSMPAYPETTAEARSHAEKLKQVLDEKRVGRVLSDANAQILKGIFQNLELASDTLEQLLKLNDPSFNEDAYGLPETEDGEDTAGKVAGTEIITGDTTDSANMDGASTASRSSDGASEPNKRRRHTYMAGFGFIPTQKEK